MNIGFECFRFSPPVSSHGDQALLLLLLLLVVIVCMTFVRRQQQKGGSRERERLEKDFEIEKKRNRRRNEFALDSLSTVFLKTPRETEREVDRNRLLFLSSVFFQPCLFPPSLSSSFLFWPELQSKMEDGMCVDVFFLRKE